MGQVALGFRSLLIKGAIFFVMASLLAWALGGTLLPRAEFADRDSVSFDGGAWFWRVTVGGREGATERWTMMRRTADGDAVPVDDRIWVEPAGPVETANTLVYGGRLQGATTWQVERVAQGKTTSTGVPDRLTVEQELARARAELE